MNSSDRNINALQHASTAYQQSENSALNYVINYASLLQTATISASVWSSASNGVTISAPANTTNTTTAKLSGTPGKYKIVNKITTSAGETVERIISLQIVSNDEDGNGDYE